MVSVSECCATLHGWNYVVFECTESVGPTRVLLRRVQAESNVVVELALVGCEGVCIKAIEDVGDVVDRPIEHEQN
jgi:hypothetical protein